jgi:hypothetical protein
MNVFVKNFTPGENIHVMKHLMILILFAVMLTACGAGNADSPMPTLMPDPAETVEAVPTDEVKSTATEEVPAAAAVEIDPASLEAGTFRVDVVNNKGETITLEPFVTDDENAKLLYVTGGYSVLDYMDPAYRQIDFTRVTRDNPDAGMTSSDVKLQLPMDVQPGTYTITSMAPNLEDGSVYGAWISIFDGDYAIYDQYEGTITITAVDDETVTGSFTVTGKNDEGYVSTASGAFNQLGAAQPIQ